MINNYQQRKLQTLLELGYKLSKEVEANNKYYSFAECSQENHLHGQNMTYKNNREEVWRDLRINRLIKKAFTYLGKKGLLN